MADKEIAKTGCQHGAGFLCEHCWPIADQEILSLMSPAQVNEAVARKLGWTEEKLTDGAGHKFIIPMDPDENWCDCLNTWFHGVPDYCHDIKAAWEILDKLYWRLNKEEFGVRCILGIPNSTGFVECTADTAPMAICLAFLKLKA